MFVFICPMLFSTPKVSGGATGAIPALPTGPTLQPRLPPLKAKVRDMQSNKALFGEHLGHARNHLDGWFSNKDWYATEW